MTLILLALSLLVSVFCLRAWRPDSELQQAALLPFADDPDAAHRLECETGLRCEEVVDVPFEPLAAPAAFHLDA